MRNALTSDPATVGQNRKRFLGLTMLSLMFLDTANQAMAHGAAGSGWVPPAAPQSSAFQSGTAGAATGWAAHNGSPISPGTLHHLAT